LMQSSSISGQADLLAHSPDDVGFWVMLLVYFELSDTVDGLGARFQPLSRPRRGPGGTSRRPMC
jgi:hypothetical protein